MTTCPECQSFRTWKYGKRFNKRGEFQKFRCRDCKRQFTDDDFLWMQTPRSAVSTALRLRNKGLSAQEIVDELKGIYDVVRSASSVYFWERKFAALFALLEKIPLRGISQRLHMDHSQLAINGEAAYLWGVKCPATKLIVGWHLSLSKEIEHAKKVLWNAKRRFLPGHELKELVTDGEQSFPRAIWEVFDHSVKHYRYVGFKDKKNNNTIERFWRCKESFPQFRSFESARRFIGIWIATYNVKKSKQLSESYEAFKLAQTIKIWHFSSCDF